MILKHFKFYSPLILLVSLFFGHLASADEVSDILGDVPLMEGLVEDVSQRLVFDKPEGRIVEVVALGQLSQSVVQAFYQETLPALGWTANKVDFLFERDGESLEIVFQKNQGILIVNLTISPLVN